MRIVQLIDSLDYGGAEQVVASLAANQSRMGNHVRLVCLRDLGPNPVSTATLEEAGVDIVELAKPAGLHFGTLRKLTAYLRQQRIDVVHTHNHIVHHYGALAGRLAGTRGIVNTLHGSASLLAARSWTKLLYWSACSAGGCVVSVCADVQNTLRRSFRFPGTKLCVVENGIDLSRFLSIPRRQRTQTVTFGTIGRLEPVKDHSNLLSAFSLLRKRHSGVRLRILGDGTLRPELERLAADLSVKDDILFEGFSLDTPRFLEAIDVYVIASRSEGLPLTLLEAMGAGLPVVATAVGAIPDIIGRARCGWLCPAGSSESLAGAMEKALMPGREDVSLLGRKAAGEHYTLDRMTRDYQRLYETLTTANPTVAAADSNV